MRIAFLAISVFCLLVACDTIIAQPVEEPQSTQRPKSLVDAAWLAEHRDQPDVRILEVGHREHYDEGHVPGALFVDWIEDITDPAMPERYNNISQQQMEQLLSRLAVDQQTTVVVYDQFASRLATRMFWALRVYDHQRIKILDGGKQAWVTAGQELTQEVPSFAATEYRVRRVHSELQANRQYIRARLEYEKLTLIDGRPTEQYTGEQPGKVFHTGKEHTRRGHLPQAVSIPWQDNLNEDGTFKSAAAFQKLYAEQGITRQSSVVTYCNEGLHAAHPWFVLTEILGHRDVRLYDDSLSEWANTADEPLVLGQHTSP